MTLARRIIPCLDTDGQRVVKGVNFVNLRDAGDPAALAARYNSEGADELVVLDIAASRDHRPTFLETIRRVAARIGYSAYRRWRRGQCRRWPRHLALGRRQADGEYRRASPPELLTELAAEFGSQAVVLAIDAKRVGTSWEAFVRGGRETSGRDAVQWAQEGAGAAPERSC